MSYAISKCKATVGLVDGDHNVVDSMSRTELDSHANMVVLGKHAMVIADTGKTAQVTPFTPDYKSMENVPIVDGALAHVCPYTGKCHILICHNALHVPSMEHNLIPPFIMREAGLIVNDTPKIHVLEPSIQDHSIYFKDEKVRIPLSLSGIFSYFNTRTPSVEDMCDEDNVLHLTPNVLTWNPHSEAYSENEDNMLDF